MSQETGPITAEMLEEILCNDDSVYNNPSTDGHSDLNSKEFARRVSVLIAPIIAAERAAAQVEMRERCAKACENHPNCKVMRTCHDADAISIRALPIDGEDRLR